MKIYYMKQASPEWWEIRRGIPTASNFDDLISGAKTIKGVPPYSLKPTGSTSYLNKLVAEVATLNPNYFTDRDQITRNRETNYGRETEDEARGWLAMHLEKEIHQVGFLTNDEGTLGCSPDGLIYVEGKPVEGVELKCPKEETQAKYLRAPNEVPKEYLPQVHGSLIVSGLSRWHFCSYAPGLDPVHVVVEPDWYTDKLRQVLKDFLVKHEDELLKKYPEHAAFCAWRDWMRNDPPLDEFNTRLPDMSKYMHETKRRIWTLVQGHAERAGLVFDGFERKFHVPHAKDPAPVSDADIPFGNTEGEPF